MSERELPMPEADCRLDKACLDAYGSVHYLPSLFGNYLFLGIFGECLDKLRSVASEMDMICYRTQFWLLAHGSHSR